MAKDPAFLFYTADFLVGVMFMDMASRGQYITLICLQHQKGHMSLAEMEMAVGELNETVLCHFELDQEGRYFNRRAEEEINKRNSYSASRRKNRSAKKSGDDVKHMSNTCETYVEHMENENVNENEIKDKKKDVPISLGLKDEDLDEFSPPLQEAIHKWLVYKSERREKYKPTGLTCLLTQIKNKAKEFGDDAVADVILNSMSSGYKGITFDRLKAKHKDEHVRKVGNLERDAVKRMTGNGFNTSNPFLEMYEEERGNG